MSPEREQADQREAALLRAVAGGDERAFAQLYDSYASILFGLLLRILNSRAEAEDVLQEVFLQVWQRAAQFDETRGRPFTWLVTLARSRAIDRLRATGSRERAVDAAAGEAMSDSQAGVVDAVEETFRSEQAATVRRALAAIPEEQRRALLLAYVEGLSQTEIAARLKQPLGTVKTRMRSGLSKLRELLREKVGGVETAVKGGGI
ncbi:MAG TPA: sigma-70 family RNA polymerase sigma factor [Pyrinomonadaceae bacterium]|nr:sigma-70 family RNA polymerase sigma factor [Pyrinomonadaceae bacterium]